MDKENPILDLIEKIHDLNNLINKNHDYMINILRKDKHNFKNFNKIKQLYDIIIDIYKSNYENNEYLFKCLFNITVKYLSNIAGFFIYLNLRHQYKTGLITNDDVMKTCETVKKKIGFEVQNYTSMLDIFDMKKMLSITNIRNITITITPLEFSISLSSNNLNPSKINNLMIYLRNLMFETLQTIIDFDDKTNETSSNFITIPQNATMCVFVSMLTGLCYSDLNKSLIKQKLSSSKTNDFKDFVRYIITNITNDYKKYDLTDPAADCDILDFLKNEPFNTLNKLTTIIFNDIFLANYIETTEIFIENNIIKISKDIFENFINHLEFNYSYSKYGYIVELINMNLKENGDYYELIYDYENDYKMSAEEMRFQIYLYELLDIKAKHIYGDTENKYWEYINDEIEKEELEGDPEILILQHFSKLSIQSYSIQEMEGELIIQDNGILIYNGIKYKLDYILHYNDIDKCKDKKCYHCISGITYNNEDYIYNSDIKSDVISCDDGNEYAIPCSLLKQNWNKNINKDITYCTTKCKYNLECKIDNLYDNNLCYTFNTNITYVYVILK
jgi:hypothetical protein